MNISLNCKLSLSKKLRAIVGKNATLTLVSQDISDGKGTAILSLDSENLNLEGKIEDMGETSIMIVPVELAEESPNVRSPVHASIFATVPHKGATEKVVSKIAVVHAPEQEEVSRAVKKEVSIPKAFSDLKTVECASWIKNMEELIAEVSKVKNKKSDVDLDSAQNDRERAVLLEMKEKEEGISTPAWIVNDKTGSLCVNDLNINLPLNAPYDLSAISAKRIAASRDLKILLRDGYIRFVSPEKKNEIIMNVTEQEEPSDSLGVFDNHEEAMGNMGTSKGRTVVIDDNSAMEVSATNAEDLGDEESMVLNLTQNMPTIKNRTQVVSAEGDRKSTHSNNQPAIASKNPNIKTIRKKFE
jgi:hypothetical protein